MSLVDLLDVTAGACRETDPSTMGAEDLGRLVEATDVVRWEIDSLSERIARAVNNEPVPGPVKPGPKPKDPPPKDPPPKDPPPNKDDDQ